MLKRRFGGALVALTMTVAAAAVAAPASAAVPFDFVPGSTTFTQSGPGSSVGGGHPDIKMTFRLQTDPMIGMGRAAQAPRTAVMDLPPGLVGDPQAADVCPLDDVLAGEQFSGAGRCPRRAAVGHA